MKKLFRKWIIFITTLNVSLGIIQIVVFALFFALPGLQKLHENVGSRIFFALLIVWLIWEFVISRVLNARCKRVLNHNKIWENELNIGYEMMLQDEKVIDEKTGYLKFVNSIRYWLLICNGLNVLLAIIFAVILEVV